jgi:hypothetical protein
MKTFALCFFLILSGLYGFAQKNKREESREIGVFGGVSYYVGDLNPYKHFAEPHFAGGILYRKNFNKRVTLRLSATYGKVTGADSLSTNLTQNARNLSFQSRIIEIGPTIELNFVKYRPGELYNESATMFLIFGLTYFNMNPQGERNGEMYDLQTLGTEGQGSSLSDKKEYSLNQISIPLGIGFRGNIGKHFCFSLEYGIRKTFTDYLDDVSGKYVDPTALAAANGQLASYFSNQSTGDRSSQTGTYRGNPNNKDWYAFAGLSLTWAIVNRSTCRNYLD